MTTQKKKFEHFFTAFDFNNLNDVILYAVMLTMWKHIEAQDEEIVQIIRRIEKLEEAKK